MPQAQILVVDDEPLLRSMYVLRLTKAGYGVSTAEDGREALDYLKGSSVDFVLTDINMPNMDGLTLIRHLREEHPSVCIMAMSGYDNAQLAEALALGASAVFSKPFPLEELIGAIERQRAAMQAGPATVSPIRHQTNEVAL